MMLSPQHKFLVAFDSDGCVFDSMELKHKECFIPNFIRAYGLQGVSKFAREAAEFVNLYSKTRGANRFVALVEQLDWLRRRPEVHARKHPVPEVLGLKAWVARERKLGHPTLEAAIAETGDPDLQQALEWSLAVNHAVAQMVHDLPPFPGVHACLERLSSQADMIVCSQTPQAALDSEWNKQRLARFVQDIFGQERGAKAHVLAQAANHYAPQRVLMIGDSLRDRHAAEECGCLFFPINPAHEVASWRRLYEEGIDRFTSERFAGVYQDELNQAFDRLLPDSPPWPVI